MGYDRLQRVLRAERLAPAEPPSLIDSESNEVWRVGDVIVRICWRGDRRRLVREALVAERLPAEIGYPEVLAVGQDSDLSWMVRRAVPGVPVERVLDELDSQARYEVGVRLGELVRVVHSVPVPEGLDERPGLDVVGEDILPLPVPRARGLLRGLLSAARVDSWTAGLVSERLDVLEPLDPFAAPGVLLHGDAGIANLLWDGDEIVAFIDFEWARSGAPWVDVLGYIRYGDRDVARGVRDAFPEPFDGPEVPAQLQLLDVATGLRTVALWPGSRSVEGLRRAASDTASS